MLSEGMYWLICFVLYSIILYIQVVRRFATQAGTLWIRSSNNGVERNLLTALGLPPHNELPKKAAYALPLKYVPDKQTDNLI